MALSYFALIDATSVSLAGLLHSLGILGAEPMESIVKLLELGLVAIEPIPGLGPVDDFRTVLQFASPTRLLLRAHPAVAKGIRTARPVVAPPKASGAVRQVRESDGLEAILRLGRVAAGGCRTAGQTQQGTLYKRDRDRLAEDPVLACAVADGLNRWPGCPSSGWSWRAILVSLNKTRWENDLSPRLLNSGPTTRSICRR